MTPSQKETFTLMMENTDDQELIDLINHYHAIANQSLIPDCRAVYKLQARIATKVLNDRQLQATP